MSGSYGDNHGAKTAAATMRMSTASATTTELVVYEPAPDNRPIRDRRDRDLVLIPALA